MTQQRPVDAQAPEDGHEVEDLHDAKDQHTSHWDMDMLSREQLDELATVSRRKHRSHLLRLLILGGGIGLAIALVVAVAIMLLQG